MTFNLQLAASTAESIKRGTDQFCNSAGSCSNRTLQSYFPVIANTLIFLVGAIAVIMVIIGGLRFVTSNGDPKAAQGAKSTILYAVIGIVVAILAYAVVNFVIGAFGVR